MHDPIADDLVLRRLCTHDAAALESYFGSLSSESKHRFRPHPLTAEAARQLCAAAASPTLRIVIEQAGKLVAYFILDPQVPVHEATRYARFGIALESGKDFLFAPSVSDGHQNKGIGSLAMPHVLRLARQSGARSLVLMGGTQDGNARAIAFYEKFGFERVGGYQSEGFNHDMRLILEA